MNATAERIAQRLTQAGYTAYFAGGCVRDFLLQRSFQDIDIATSAHPEQVQELFPRVTDVQGKCFGVVRVMEEGQTFEVATFRKDGSYQDGRHPQEVTFSTPQEDAQRRDFTVNGLFFDPAKKEIIDYVQGQADLQARRLRAIGNPVQRFEEDHLRIFRALRFAVQLDFEIEANTWDALCQMKQSTLRLAPERVRDELVKSFTSAQPQRALDLLDASGLLQLWLPEVSAQKGVQQPPQFHPEGDVYVHVRMMMGMLSHPSLELAFGTLLHDIGKVPTFKIDDNGRIRFNGHETVGARMTQQWMEKLRFSNHQIEAVTAIVANHMAFKDVPSMRLSTLKRFMARPHFQQELAMHRIDCLCSHGELDIYQYLLQKQEEFSQEPILPPPLLNGNDILALGIPAGPLIGQILRLVQDDQLEGKLTDRDSALIRAAEIASQHRPES